MIGYRAYLISPTPVQPVRRARVSAMNRGGAQRVRGRCESQPPTITDSTLTFFPLQLQIDDGTQRTNLSTIDAQFLPALLCSTILFSFEYGRYYSHQLCSIVTRLGPRTLPHPQPLRTSTISLCSNTRTRRDCGSKGVSLEFVSGRGVQSKL